MKKKLFVHYDKEGDFLEIRFGQPTPSVYEDLGNDTFVRKDEATKEIKGYAIFNVQKRKEKKMHELELELPQLITS